MQQATEQEPSKERKDMKALAVQLKSKEAVFRIGTYRQKVTQAAVPLNPLKRKAVRIVNPIYRYSLSPFIHVAKSNKRRVIAMEVRYLRAALPRIPYRRRHAGHTLQRLTRVMDPPPGVPAKFFSSQGVRHSAHAKEERDLQERVYKLAFHTPTQSSFTCGGKPPGRLYQYLSLYEPGPW